MSKIYFVERCMYSVRLKHLRKLAKNSKLFVVSENLDQTIEYIIASSSTKQQVLEYLSSSKQCDEHLLKFLSNKCCFLDVSWFSKCMQNKAIITPEVSHKLIEVTEEPLGKKPKVEENNRKSFPAYACQCKCPLDHPNKKYADALEILEEHALLRAEPNSRTRALAFRRGSATLKSMTYPIIHEDDIKHLPYIDNSSSGKLGHCKRVVLDILHSGSSNEVEGVKNSEHYKSLKAFCGIFGVGPQTGQKWFNKNLRTIDDIKNATDITFSQDQQYGLRYYNDLNTPVTKEMAIEIKKIINETAQKIQQGLEIYLVGGFRRGKQFGHDVDLLITHKEVGKEQNVLVKILNILKDKFIYSNKFQKGSDYQNKESTRMDNYEKCFAIFKYDDGGMSNIAVRVDLIIVPYNQLPFALLGWTGSKHFEREIRRFAKSEKNITLTSNGMYAGDNISIDAACEEDIFKTLELEYLEPKYRNC